MLLVSSVALAIRSFLEGMLTDLKEVYRASMKEFREQQLDSPTIRIRNAIKADTRIATIVQAQNSTSRCVRV